METKTLTDFEAVGLDRNLNLADGHAYQELGKQYSDIIEELGAIWKISEATSVPTAEQAFREAFSAVSGFTSIASLPFFKICPTASNSIDIVGAVLAAKGLETSLVEPAFDNLSLLLRRRGVMLNPIGETALFEERVAYDLERQDPNQGGALFLVQPGNPTGRCLTEPALRKLAEYCVLRKKLLVMDNSFRLYNRQPFDDYSVLLESGVSFLSFEDTGKALPTHDLKASLLFCTPDLEELVNTIYNEMYLCHSRFVLMVLTRLLWRTADCGLGPALWQTVDERRSILRRSLVDTGIEIDETSRESQISVEWLDCRGTGLTDLELTHFLAQNGVLVLPGRLFFWHSSHDTERHHNIRVALMKPEMRLIEAIGKFSTLLRDRYQGKS